MTAMSEDSWQLFAIRLITWGLFIFFARLKMSITPILFCCPFFMANEIWGEYLSPGRGLLCSSQNALHRKPRWWRSADRKMFKQTEKCRTMNSLRKVPINVKPEVGMGMRATHRNLIVISDPWVGILIVRDVPWNMTRSPSWETKREPFANLQISRR